ncbi:MAG TPA: tRNA (N6-isopentenyl adenosine(37)-C2)-methylthiotransferase MiaB, partial [Clostridiales bacterium]|nr:tRNA (N6-isopentenyl adenosine(37)-C2)-methylthiotransferase MiaB [Clostridiales bacterium]
NRKYTKEQYLDKVKTIRSIIPDCAISTDIIVGFPTETEQDFQETLSVVEQARFSGAFTFVYSKRSGTIADKMEGQIDKETKKDRITRLVAYQNDLTRDQTKSYKGKTIEILVEDYDKKRNLYMGRDVYNRMGYFACEQDKIGEFVNIKINKVNGISLFGELVDGE